MKQKNFCVGLFGMPYLYQSGDPNFHLHMVELGLRRGSPMLSSCENKVILATMYEYFLYDYNGDIELFCNECDIIPTYTEEDFINEIKNQLNK